MGNSKTGLYIPLLLLLLLLLLHPYHVLLCVGYRHVWLFVSDEQRFKPRITSTGPLAHPYLVSLWCCHCCPKHWHPSQDPQKINMAILGMEHRQNWFIDVNFIELDDGKIYRKALYLMVKTMVSCRFSLKPIQRQLWKLLEVFRRISGIPTRRFTNCRTPSHPQATDHSLTILLAATKRGYEFSQVPPCSR